MSLVIKEIPEGGYAFQMETEDGFYEGTSLDLIQLAKWIMSKKKPPVLQAEFKRVKESA